MISTLYGQVFWTVMDPVPLPPAIVAQFKDKTMAITGYGGGSWSFVDWRERWAGGWWMVDGRWWVVVGGWRVAGGGWCAVVGGRWRQR